MSGPAAGGLPPGAGADDTILPYHVEALDLRGRVARLGPALDTILKRHAYPEPVSRALGEAIVVTVLLGTALKGEGRFQLQTKTDGAISLIVVDFDAPDRIRATAHFDVAAVAVADADTASLIGHGHLAFTIDQGVRAPARYQGIVALEGQGLEAAARQYFRQSEQIPTEIRIAVAERIDARGRAWRAGGILAQFLPASEDRMRRADLDPGDAPAGAKRDLRPDDDAWAEARSLVLTAGADELVDPLLAPEQLLYRLFHERGVAVQPAQRIVEACRCSRRRIISTLKSFPESDRSGMAGADGKIKVTCEFCSTVYELKPDEILEGRGKLDVSG